MCASALKALMYVCNYLLNNISLHSVKFLNNPQVEFSRLAAFNSSQFHFGARKIQGAPCSIPEDWSGQARPSVETNKEKYHE